jgi:hypothetical protein
MTDKGDEAPGVPTFSESLSAAARKSGLGQLNPDEPPTAAALLGALGGVRGLIESVLPGFAFLLLYTITRDLFVSVIVPVVIAVGFVVARGVTRSPMAPALAGALGIALTSVLSLVTNRAENNFLPGIVINVVMLVVLIVSILVRWPLVGVVIGMLVGDGTDWRADRLKRRALTLATWIWMIPSAIRVAVPHRTSGPSRGHQADHGNPALPCRPLGHVAAGACRLQQTRHRRLDTSWRGVSVFRAVAPCYIYLDVEIV